MLVNQPTVLDTSKSSLISSLPCPSTSTFTSFFPLHSPNASAKAVNSTSLICVRYTSGTSFNNSNVSSSLNSTFTLLTDSSVFSPPSLSNGNHPPSSLSSSSQYSSSFLNSSLPAYSFNFLPHSWYELVFSSSFTSSPRLTPS